MEIPFETIAHTDFRNAGPGEGLATFTLSQPPLFYLEHITSPRSGGGYGGGLIKTWKKCSDWTEGTQASLVLRHDLIGSAVQLAHVLQDLRNFRTRASLPLISPPSFSSTGEIIGATSAGPSLSLQIPQPPLAALQGHNYSSSAGHLQRPQFVAHSRKRSSSDTSVFAHHPPSSYSGNDYGTEGSFHGMGAPRSASYSSTSFSSQLPLSRPSPISIPVSYSQAYVQRPSTDYLPHDSSSPLQHNDPSSGDYSTVPISHASLHRSSFSTPAAHYNEPLRNSPPYTLSPSKNEPDASGLVSHYSASSTLDTSYQTHSNDSGLTDSRSSSLQNMGSLAQPSAISPSSGDSTSIPQVLQYYVQDASQQDRPQSHGSSDQLHSVSLTGALGSSSSSSSPPGPRTMMPPPSIE